MKIVLGPFRLPWGIQHKTEGSGWPFLALFPAWLFSVTLYMSCRFSLEWHPTPTVRSRGLVSASCRRSRRSGCSKFRHCVEFVHCMVVFSISLPVGQITRQVSMAATWFFSVSMSCHHPKRIVWDWGSNSIAFGLCTSPTAFRKITLCRGGKSTQSTEYAPTTAGAWRTISSTNFMGFVEKKYSNYVWEECW